MRLIYTFIVNNANVAMSTVEEDEITNAIADYCNVDFDDVEQDFEEEIEEEEQ